MLIFCILALQMGHLVSQVANLSLTEQSWQQHAWPQGSRTVFTVASKQILHSSLFLYDSLSSMETTGPIFSALDAALGLSLVGIAAATEVILEREFCLILGVKELVMDWMRRPAWASSDSCSICSGVLVTKL